MLMRRCLVIAAILASATLAASHATAQTVTIELLDPAYLPQAQGWSATTLPDGSPDIATNGSYITSNTIGAVAGPSSPDSAVQWLSREIPMRVAEGFAIEVSLRVNRVQTPHNWLDGGIVFSGSTTDPRASLAAGPSGQLIFFDEDRIGWGDDSQSLAMDTTDRFHLYTLTVDRFGFARVFVDNVLALTKAGFIALPRVGFGDMSNDIGVNGSVSIARMTMTGTPNATPQDDEIPQTGWTLWSVDSAGPGYPGTFAFDGNPGTAWTTSWTPSVAPLPHDLQINLGATYDINGFRHVPRQDGSRIGRIGVYEFYVSADGIDWGAPVSVGTLLDFVNQQDVFFPARTGRFVRLLVRTSLDGAPYTTLAELKLFKGTLSPPVVMSVDPSEGAQGTGNLAVTVRGNFTHFALSSAVTFSGTGVTAGTPTAATATNLTVPVTIAAFAELGPRTVTVTTGAEVVSLVQGFAVTGGTTPPGILSQAHWTLHYVDSAEGGSAYAATNAFDGDRGTTWTTAWSPTIAALPHDLQINLGALYNISGFRHLPRQDGAPYGRIGQYEFYVSVDGASWGLPVATGTLQNILAEQEVLFPATTGQYVWLRALTSLAGSPFTTLTELNVVGVSVPAGTPALTSVAPSSAPQGVTNLAVTLTGTFTHFSLASVVTFNGNWVTAGAPTAATATSLTVPVTIAAFAELGPRTVVVRTGGEVLFVHGFTVTAGTTSRVIPQANWTLHHVDSAQEGSLYAATNAFDGNRETVWTTAWTPAITALPHDLQINLGATYKISGFRYLPRQDGQPYGRIGDYEFYVSSDGVNWGAPVATGTLQNLLTEQEVLFPTQTAKYIWLRALSSLAGAPFTTLAELNLVAPISPRDLGTLGGSRSVAVAINDSGQVVGYTGGTTATRTFLWTPIDGMVDIGSFTPRAINASGQVVGTGALQAVSWSASTGITALGTLPNEGLSRVSEAVAVNDSGMVVGSSTIADGYHAFAWTASGGMVDLGSLTGGRVDSWSKAAAVNASGQVVGYSRAPDDKFHAFSWTASGGMIDLGLLDGNITEAVAVNASGQIVGYSHLGTSITDPVSHAFSWTASGGMVDLGPGGALAVNDQGQVVGYTSVSATTHAFLWTAAGGMVDLGPGVAEAVNASGTVAGYAIFPIHVFPRGEIALEASVWTAGGIRVPLGTIGGIVSRAHAVNAAGQIAGDSETTPLGSVEAHAVLWQVGND